MKEYIEREALLDDFGAEPLVLDEYDGEQRQEHWDWHRYTTIVKKHPAADVVPVVHGWWIKTEQENGCAMWTEFECSVCGSVFDGTELLFDEWKGCPVCLARMDGK